jgi:hypothetical protein
VLLSVVSNVVVLLSCYLHCCITSRYLTLHYCAVNISVVTCSETHYCQNGFATFQLDLNPTLYSYSYSRAKTNCVPFQGAASPIVASMCLPLFLERVAFLMRFESYKAGEIRCCTVRAIRAHFEMRCPLLAARCGILNLIPLEKCPEADCTSCLSNTRSKLQDFGLFS